MKTKLPTAAKYIAAIAMTTTLAWFVPTDAAPDWQTAHTASYKLHFGPGTDADAEVIGKFLNAAYEKIAGEFHKHEPAALLKGVRLDVYLHPRPGRMASAQHATMTSNLRRENYKAEIHMLTPGAYTAEKLPTTSDERRTDYIYRQIVHEIAALHVQRLILQKPTGWRYDDAAPWFLQGYDEYLSGVHGRRSEDATLETYRDRIRRDPGRVRFGNGIEARNPYSDGAVVVEFLHHSFGRDAVQNIWLSQEPTFDRAVVSALGTSYADLEKRWRAWLTSI